MLNTMPIIIFLSSFWLYILPVIGLVIFTYIMFKLDHVGEYTTLYDFLYESWMFLVMSFFPIFNMVIFYVGSIILLSIILWNFLCNLASKIRI